MNLQALNEFVYASHNKVEAVDAWAVTVNDAITDHAVRIDQSKLKFSSTMLEIKTETDEIRAVITTTAPLLKGTRVRL